MANEKNIEVMLKDVRISFFHGFTPQERKDDDGKVTGYNFSLNALLDKDKDKALIEAVKEAMKKAKLARWADNGPRIPPERLCMRDGEPVDPETEERSPLYDGYKNAMFVSANRGVSISEWEDQRKNPVRLIGPKKTAKDKQGKPCFPDIKEADGLLYSGCYANVLIRVYAYDGKGKNPNRINASLEAVQFVRHGEAFGSAPVDVDNVFDEVEGGDDMLEGGTTSSGVDDDDLGI